MKAADAAAEPAHYVGHRMRLKARFREAGGDALADYELLELILFRAIPQRDVKPLAKKLIERFGSFAEALAAPPATIGGSRRHERERDHGIQDRGGQAPSASPRSWRATAVR